MTKIFAIELDAQAHQVGDHEAQEPGSPSETPPMVPALSLVDQAVSDAHRVVSLLDGASEQVIQAGELVYGALTMYRGELPALKRFIAVLVRANVLTARDGQLLERSPKLQKLAKIGQYPDLARLPEISSRIRGYSGLHQALVLHESLPGDESERTDALLTILATAEAKGVLTRQYLEQQTRRVKSERRNRADNRPKHIPSPDGAPESEPSSYGLVLMTPTEDDLKRIADTFFDESNIGLCGQVYERCEDAVTVVVAPLRFLPVVTSLLLQGFDEPRVFLFSEPVGPDVTDARAIIVAARGRDANPLTECITWDGDDDVSQLAERIAPDARNRLHVFADQKREGWHALTGNANWRMDW